ncbi:MAG: AmmeMemoRadiSam system radical SAM enzyme [Elusimicrobiota bacterium]
MDLKISRREFLLKSLPLAGAAVGANVLAVAAGWAMHRWKVPRLFSSLWPADNPYVREARWWRVACAGVQCTLCPFQCFLPEGQRGICRVRLNQGGRLVTLVWGHPVSVHVDPIEKKPVFHLLPGSPIYSLAAVGCSLRCSFCQNWAISQTFPEEAENTTLVPYDLGLFSASGGRVMARLEQKEIAFLSPQDIVAFAKKTFCRSIAYTYSEPIVFYEYVYASARLAKEAGLKNVMVSCGYINPEPLAEAAPYFDVIKIDLKGFNENFYRKIVGGQLKFVLQTLVELKKRGVFTEIVNLVVPALNDDLGEIRLMCRWVKENLGRDVPLFFSRFHPDYRLENLPATPVETLDKARQTALAEGLHYVYIGNTPGHPGENTYCPTCGNVLIRRYGYAVLENKIGSSGLCPYDGTRIPGIWS